MQLLIVTHLACDVSRSEKRQVFSDLMQNGDIRVHCDAMLSL